MYLQTLVCMLFPFLSSSSPVPAAGPQSEKTRTGAQFQTQNTSSYIEEVTLSLTVPVPPAWPNQTADSFQFFPAVGTDKANIVVRPTFQSFANPAEHCGGKGGQWCVLNNEGGVRVQDCGPPTGQTCPVDQAPSADVGDATPAAVSPGDHLDWQFTYDDATGNATSVLRRAGVTLSAASGVAGKGLYFAASEVAWDDFHGAVGPYVFRNISIRLGAADKNFGGNAMFVAPGGTRPTSAGDITSQDGGKNWHMPQLDLLKVTIPPAQAPKS